MPIVLPPRMVSLHSGTPECRRRLDHQNPVPQGSGAGGWASIDYVFNRGGRSKSIDEEQLKQLAKEVRVLRRLVYELVAMLAALVYLWITCGELLV